METAPTTALFGGQTFDLSPVSLEDDYDDLGNLSDGDSIEQHDPSAGPKRRTRRLPSTAEKRANHNAIERARRESLNGRFMELARALPTMNVNKRPSKNSIVTKSLDYVKNARLREQALESENARLRKEVNELRAKLGMPPETSVPTTVTSAAPIISAVKQEVATPTLSARSVAVMTSKPVSPAAKVANQVRQNATSVPPMSPYLSHGPLAASNGFFGFIDPFAASSAGPTAAAAAAAAATAKIHSAQSPQDSNSDSESSLAHTPPSYQHSFPSHPSFFMEENVHAPALTIENDFLAQCGIQSSYSATSGLQGWPHTSMSLNFGAAPTGFPLFA